MWTQDLAPPTWGEPGWTPPPAPPKRRTWPQLLAALLILLGGTWHASSYVDVEGLAAGTGIFELPDLPSTEPEAAPVPLGMPPPYTGIGEHAYMYTHPDGTPVAYDPCKPIHYVIRADGAPDGGVGAVHQAISEITSATGLQFVYDGTTDEVPTDDRDPTQGRYGERWAPVLIAWSTPEESPKLEGITVGIAGSQAIGTSEEDYRYITGEVLLDGPQMREIAEEEDGVATNQGIILHELGHLVGLDHVDDPSQLMYTETVEGLHTFGVGDLQGLAALGGGKCYPDLSLE